MEEGRVRSGSYASVHMVQAPEEGQRSSYWLRVGS